jgi:phosphohistidine phosphatase SixA
MADQKAYFRQHGLAIDKADEPERPLSKKVVHQTKLRASQTAEIVIATLNIPTAKIISHNI